MRISIFEQNLRSIGNHLPVSSLEGVREAFVAILVELYNKLHSNGTGDLNFGRCVQLNT